MNFRVPFVPWSPLTGILINNILLAQLVRTPFIEALSIWYDRPNLISYHLQSWLSLLLLLIYICLAIVFFCIHVFFSGRSAQDEWQLLRRTQNNESECEVDTPAHAAGAINAGGSRWYSDPARLLVWNPWESLRDSSIALAMRGRGIVV